jgi:hypothetical protein
MSFDRKRLESTMQGIIHKPTPTGSPNFGQRMAAARSAKGQNTAPPSKPVTTTPGPLKVKDKPMKPIKGKPLAGPLGGDSSPKLKPRGTHGVHVHIHLPASDPDSDS